MPPFANYLNTPDNVIPIFPDPRQPLIDLVPAK
jgi:hypothetical protein